MRRRNEKHLAFIRTLPCISCLDNTGTQAAHIRFADARIAKPITGIAIKPDDRFVLPLCQTCHQGQHNMNERKFWEWKGIDPVLTSLAIYSVSGDAEAAEEIISATKSTR